MTRRLLLFAVAALSLAAAAPQAQAHRYAASKPCAGRVLHVGHPGPLRCLRAAQWLLRGRDPAVRKGVYWRVYRGPLAFSYGKKTASSVRRVKYRLGFPVKYVSGHFGPVLRSYLLGKADLPLAYNVRSGNRRNAYERQRKALAAARVNWQFKIVRAAKYLIAHSDRVSYCLCSRRMTIVRGRLKVPPSPVSRITEDCSSAVTGLYMQVGGPDPNGNIGGRPFSGWGYTGTQVRQGRQVWRRGQPLGLLRVGDVIFYGRGFPYGHEAMYIGRGRIFSHGSEGGPYDLPALYRGDSAQARRYRE